MLFLICKLCIVDLLYISKTGSNKKGIMDLLIVMPTYRPLSSMVMYKDCVDDHDVAKRSDGNGNKAVPGGEQL